MNAWLVQDAGGRDLGSPEGRHPGAGRTSRVRDADPAPVQPPPLDQTVTHPWPSYTMLELGALPEAVPCARAHAKIMLLIWGLSELSESVELLVTELVSNAVKATQELKSPIRPPVRMRLSTDGRRVLIEMWDASALMPVPTEASFEAESGRGLRLVDAISDKWGHYATTDGGKVVWAEIAR